MKKLIKSVAVLSIATIMAVNAFACNKPKEETGNIEVWTAYGTEKILREIDYSKRYSEDVLTINAFRNEYESAQIIISPDIDVKEYTITLSDLTNENGDKLLKDKFSVYNQKYINVTDIKDSESQTGAGYYPDALLPYDVAVTYGENVIAKGENQGLWITLKTDKNQPAGVYTGNFVVNADGQTITVPVKVTVYDYTLSEKVHSKSSFLINAEEMALGELDCTQEMIEAYHDFFLEHRVSPNHLAANDLYGVLENEALESFLDYAEKATLDPRCSNFHITYAMSSETIRVNGKSVSIQTVDYDLFEKTLRAMAERSMEKGVNLFEKAATYFVFFDEYDVNKKVDTANYNLQKSDQLCHSLATELNEQYFDVDQDFKEEVLNSLAGIRHKCVGSLTSNLTSKATMVPTIDKYHTAEGRALYSDWSKEWYGEDGELWTYTCMNPDPPHPTYHTEDVLISSRLLSWMMYDYNITGNLYWCTTLYAYSDGYVTSGQLQDYYDKALRFPQANGDGYLVYPGRPYGIKGPVGTIRLNSIRDGNEDYDILWQLENELYAKRNVSGENFENVLKYLVQDLYNGTKCNTDKEINEIFAQSRSKLADLIVLADKTGTVIENAVTSSGKTTFTISTEEGVTLNVNGANLTNGTTSNGVTTYTVDVELNKDENTLSVKATKENKTYSIDLLLGGKVVESLFANMEDKIELRTQTAVKEKVTFEEQEVIKLTERGNEMSVQLDVKSFAIGANIKTITLKIYSERASSLEIRGKCEKHGAYVSVTETTLKAGWNEVVVDVYSLNCNANGILHGLRLNFESRNGLSVMLANMTIAGGGR